MMGTQRQGGMRHSSALSSVTTHPRWRPRRKKRCDMSEYKYDHLNFYGLPHVELSTKDYNTQEKGREKSREKIVNTTRLRCGAEGLQ
jgi:hypothetical protein